MTEWTKSEIEAAARAICRSREWDEGVFWKTALPDAKAALAAVPRVPEGYWLAPDEPSAEMDGAAISATSSARTDADGFYDLHCIFQRQYRAARDAAKGQADG